MSSVSLRSLVVNFLRKLNIKYEKLAFNSDVNSCSICMEIIEEIKELLIDDEKNDNAEYELLHNYPIICKMDCLKQALMNALKVQQFEMAKSLQNQMEELRYDPSEEEKGLTLIDIKNRLEALIKRLKDR